MRSYIESDEFGRTKINAHNIDSDRLTNNKSLGICIGASTISSVLLEVDEAGILKISHTLRVKGDGSPKNALTKTLDHYLSISDDIPTVVTGRKFRNRIRMATISESEATEMALSLYPSKEYTAIASLGAETFIVYELNSENKIRKLIAKNQCASGTGEFFMQQIGRMNLDPEMAVAISAGSEPFVVSGRCSVFCKSDCTHALNKGIPKENVTAGLALMIAGKAEELLKMSRPGKFMLIGGVTQNSTVVSFLREKFDNVIVPEEATYFEALGAALYGLFNKVTDYSAGMEIFSESESLFTFHKPLSKYLDLVTFLQQDEVKAGASDTCILGLDVGSTTTKGVLIRTGDDRIVASAYLYTHGNPVKASIDVYAELEKQINVPVNIIGLGVTGSGRHIAALHSNSHAVINEISAHARASVYFDPDVDTIFEIGGQDAKYTFINNKVPADYAMNEACSAGTGSFIQEAAWETLKTDLKDIEGKAFKSEMPLNFRDQCSALIGSDIKSALQENYSHNDILAGLVYSVCMNYINRVKGRRPLGKKILMQGGVCYNKAIPVAMAAITGKPVIVPPSPGLMGAFGTALMVKEKIDRGEISKQDYILKDLVSREFSTGKSFICRDKASGCDRKCEINTFKVNNKIIAFGGACNKYYDAFTYTEKDWQKNDFVSKRMEKVFLKETGMERAFLKGTGIERAFLKDTDLLPIPNNTEAGKKVVGMNLSFTINRLFPLYYTFFNELGFKVVLPEKIDKEGFNKQHSSFCYPAELAHGFFKSLVDMQPDFIFMPEIYELQVEGCENDDKDSSATCVFISKEINYLSQAFRFEESRIIHPYLNFAKGIESQKSVFLKIASDIGVKSKETALNAFRKAMYQQEKTEEDLYSLGSRTLDKLSLNPSEIAIVLVGRDYNAFTDIANKGIPQKFASLGYKVLPYDIIDCSEEDISYYQSWESGKRIIRAAEFIKRHPQLFPVYISNFSCGPDSFLVPIFRTILGNKPSLTLELDQHTADAGINTRIDAFLDVVNNYFIRSKEFHVNGISDFIPSKIINKASGPTFVDSKGRNLNLLKDKVKIIIPCIGDMASALFAASLRSLGYNAEALPETDQSVLETGQRNTSGKECLPIVLLVGSLLNYVNNSRTDGEPIAFFNIGGTSACRIAQYPGMLERVVKAENIHDVAMFTLISQEGYMGFSTAFLKRSIEAIILNDILEDVRSGILANAKDPETGLSIFYEQFESLVSVFSNDYKNLFTELRRFSSYLAENVPCRIPVSESKYIALTGEIFIRHNQFAHKRLNHYFGKRGFILKDAYISEWVKYLDYAWRKGVDRPKYTFFEVLNRLVREQYITFMEAKMQRILAASNYLKPHKTRVINIIKHSLHVLPLESTGEPALTLGTALAQGYEEFCGIINIGPFGCLQTRIGEAICTPNMTLGHKKTVKKNLNIEYTFPDGLTEDTDIPFLTIECDGKGFPQIIESRLETFLVQAERVAASISI